MLVAWLLGLVAFAGSASCRSHRIVGGTTTTIDQFPGIVQVDMQSIFFPGHWSSSCAANILTSRTVLSAAHCFAGPQFEPRHRRIRAGTTYRSNGGILGYVQAVFNHPEFGSFGWEADISVVRLIDRLIYSPVIQQIAIPPRDTVIPDNLPVKQAGWGSITEVGPLSDVLKYVRVNTINNNVCYERYATLPDRPPVTKRMICSGLLDVGGADACGGDSGGPLYFGNILIGVISWGEGCGNATFPGVNIAVAPFFDWIVHHTI